MNPSESSFYKKLYTAIGLLIFVQLIGIAGFILIEDYSLAEAFYMTVIVVSTVGLSAVHELSTEGRVFIACLIIISLGIFTYAISIVTGYIMEGDFRKYLKYRKVKAKIQEQNNHIIVCGYGRNGKQACEQLRLNKREFVVVEKSTGITAQLRSSNSTLFVEGDATNDEILAEAGIDRASALITTLPDDADNVFVVLTARGLNSKMKIISRASEDSSFNKIKRAGADNVIMPDKIGGSHMAALIANPDVLEFIDVITGRATFSLEEIAFKNCPSNIIGCTLKQINAIDESGVNVIGMKTNDGNYLVNPSRDTVITSETKLFVLGGAGQIEKLKSSLR